jgi:hypothetical protein
MNQGLREAIALRLQDNMPYRDIIKELRTTAVTISSVARERGLTRREHKANNWAEIQTYIDSGHSVAQAQEKFGFSGWQYERAVKYGQVSTGDNNSVIEAYISEPWNTRARSVERLIRSGRLEAKCSVCRRKTWLGEPLAFELYHKNGDVKDSRLENLSLVCPNCFATTDEGLQLGRARPVVP